MMMREIGYLVATFVLVAGLLWVGTPARPGREHVHTELRYVMRGRLNVDTLCRTDTMLIIRGEHRPVPEVLRNVVWQELGRPQPIVDKPLD